MNELYGQMSEELPSHNYPSNSVIYQYMTCDRIRQMSGMIWYPRWSFMVIFFSILTTIFNFCSGRVVCDNVLYLTMDQVHCMNYVYMCGVYRINHFH